MLLSGSACKQVVIKTLHAVIRSRGGQRRPASWTPTTCTVPPACSPIPTPGSLKGAGSGTQSLFFPIRGKRTCATVAQLYILVMWRTHTGQVKVKDSAINSIKSMHPAQPKSTTTKTPIDDILLQKRQLHVSSLTSRGFITVVAVDSQKVQGGAEPHRLPKICSQLYTDTNTGPQTQVLTKPLPRAKSRTASTRSPGATMHMVLTGVPTKFYFPSSSYSHPRYFWNLFLK